MMRHKPVVAETQIKVSSVTEPQETGRQLTVDEIFASLEWAG